MNSVCEVCEKTFSGENTKAVHFMWKHGGQERTENIRAKQSLSHKDRLSKFSPEERIEHIKRSALSVPRWNAGKTLPEPMKTKVLRGLKLAAATHSREHKVTNKCANCGKLFDTPKSLARLYCSHKCVMTDPKYRQRISATVKALHQDPDYVKKFMDGRHTMTANPNWRYNILIRRIPTKPEIIATNLLNDKFPREYKYVGNGVIWVGRFNPDFININGKKKIIEVWGDHWHRDDDPDQRISYFRNYGFDTLIIWEHELLKPNDVIERLEVFHQL